MMKFLYRPLLSFLAASLFPFYVTAMEESSEKDDSSSSTLSHKLTKAEISEKKNQSLTFDGHASDATIQKALSQEENKNVRNIEFKGCSFITKETLLALKNASELRRITLLNPNISMANEEDFNAIKDLLNVIKERSGTKSFSLTGETPDRKRCFTNGKIKQLRDEFREIEINQESKKGTKKTREDKKAIKEAQQRKVDIEKSLKTQKKHVNKEIKKEWQNERRDAKKSRGK